MGSLHSIGIVCLLILGTVSAEGGDEEAYNDWDQYSDSYEQWKDEQGSSLDYPSFARDRYDKANKSSKYSIPVEHQTSSSYPRNSYGNSFYPGLIPSWDWPYPRGRDGDNFEPYYLEGNPLWYPTPRNHRNQQPNIRRPWSYPRRRKRPWWYPTERRPSWYMRRPWRQPHHENGNNVGPLSFRRRPWWYPEYGSMGNDVPYYIIKRPWWPPRERNAFPYYSIRNPWNYIRQRPLSMLEPNYIRKPWWLPFRNKRIRPKAKTPKTVEIIEEIDYPIDDIRRKIPTHTKRPKIIEIVKEIDYPWPMVRPQKQLQNFKTKKPHELEIVEYIDYPSPEQTTRTPKKNELVLEVIKDYDYQEEEKRTTTTRPKIIEVVEEIDYPSRNGKDIGILQIEEDIDYIEERKHTKRPQKTSKPGIIEIIKDIDYEEPQTWWKKHTSYTKAYTIQPSIPGFTPNIEVDIEYLWDNSNISKKTSTETVTHNYGRTYYPVQITYYPWTKEHETKNSSEVTKKMRETTYPGQHWKTRNPWPFTYYPWSTTSNPRTRHTTQNVEYETGETFYPLPRTRTPIAFTYYPWPQTRTRTPTPFTYYPWPPRKTRTPLPFTYYPWDLPRTRSPWPFTYYPLPRTRTPWPFTYYPWATTPSTPQYFTGETYYPRLKKTTTTKPWQFTLYPWTTTSRPLTRSTSQRITGGTYYPRPKTRNPWPFTYYPWPSKPRTETTTFRPPWKQTFYPWATSTPSSELEFLVEETAYPYSTTRNPWPFTYYPWHTTSKHRTTQNVQRVTGETFYPLPRTRTPWPFTYYPLPRTRTPWPFTYYPWPTTSKQYFTGETFYPQWTTSRPFTLYPWTTTSRNVRHRTGETFYPYSTTRTPWPFTYMPWTTATPKRRTQYITGETYYPRPRTRRPSEEFTYYPWPKTWKPQPHTGQTFYPRPMTTWEFTYYPWATTPSTPQYFTGETYYPRLKKTTTTKPWQFTLYPWTTTSRPLTRSTSQRITGGTYYPRPKTRYPWPFTYYPWPATSKSRKPQYMTRETYYPYTISRYPTGFTYYPWSTTGMTYYPFLKSTTKKAVKNYDEYEGEIDILGYNRHYKSTPVQSFTPEYADYSGELDLKFVRPPRPSNHYVDYEGVVDIGLRRKTTTPKFEQLDDYIDYEGEIDFIRRPVHMRKRPHYRKIRLPSEVVNFYEPIIVILEDGSYLSKSHINVEKLLLGLEDLKFKLPWLEDTEILEPNIVYLQQEDKVQPYITDKKHLKKHLLGDYIASQDWKFMEPDHRVIRIVRSWQRPSRVTPRHVDNINNRVINPKFRKPNSYMGSGISLPKRAWNYLKSLLNSDGGSEEPKTSLPQNIWKYLKGLLPESVLGKKNPEINNIRHRDKGIDINPSIEKPLQETPIDSYNLPKLNKYFPRISQSNNPSKTNLRIPTHNIQRDNNANAKADSPHYNYRSHNIPKFRVNDNQNNMLNFMRNKFANYKVPNPNLDYAENKNPFYNRKQNLQPDEGRNDRPHPNFKLNNLKPNYGKSLHTLNLPENRQNYKLNVQGHEIPDYGQEKSKNNDWRQIYDMQNDNQGISYGDNSYDSYQNE